MTETVFWLSIAFMAVSCLVSFALPVALLLWLRFVKKADLLPFFIGCAVMLLFALILESGVHRLVLGSAVGERIQGSTWLYALYGGFMAGLFEETGRFVAFKTVLRKKRDKDVNALMYGAGHGGFEAVVLVGLAMINNIVFSVLINLGQTELLTGSLSGELLTQIETAINQLITTPSYQFLLSGVERIIAVALHLSLSVLVWFAAKTRGKAYLYPVAIVLHMLVDGLVVVFSGFGLPTPALEGILLVMTALVALFAKRVWDRNAYSEVVFGGD